MMHPRCVIIDLVWFYIATRGLKGVSGSSIRTTGAGIVLSVVNGVIISITHRLTRAEQNTAAGIYIARSVCLYQNVLNIGLLNGSYSKESADRLDKIYIWSVFSLRAEAGSINLVFQSPLIAKKEFWLSSHTNLLITD